MIGIAKTLGRLIAVLVHLDVIEEELAEWILEPLEDEQGKVESEEYI